MHLFICLWIWFYLSSFSFKSTSPLFSVILPIASNC
jgi:hypothetical protein